MTSPQEDDAKVSMLGASSVAPPLSYRIQLSEAWKFRDTVIDAQVTRLMRITRRLGRQSCKGIRMYRDHLTSLLLQRQIVRRGFPKNVFPVVLYYPCGKQYHRLSVTFAHTKPISRDTTRVWNIFFIPHKAANAKKTQKD
jgi:hypothetical protein